jgi:divalent metal cation (Fe/Co/Zn/Cd) transporter
VLIAVNLVLADNLNMRQAGTVTAKVENCIKQVYSDIDKSKIYIQYDNNGASKTEEVREETTDRSEAS